MTFTYKIGQLDANMMEYKKYSLYLNEFRKNLATNLDRSPLIHSYGYASAGDQSTLYAIFPLNFVPFMQHPG
jgi:hypothetical protein